MKPIVSSAPGKVVLSGEYAVLDGMSAVSMAVNRRATVTIEAAERTSIRSVGMAGDTDTRLFECVCDALAIDHWCGAALLDTGAFVDTVSGVKLGIGSSAALTVGLVRALAPGDIGETELIRCSQEAHLAFQKGVGSGVDIATSIVGGLVEYRVGEVPRLLAWPDGLHYQLLWSGVPAKTAEKLRRLSDSKTNRSDNALDYASTNIAAAWSSGNAATIVHEYRDYLQALQQFNVDHDLGIFDAGHDALVGSEKPVDIVYKPCGAGGGDIGIVLGTDRPAVTTFALNARELGFRQLDMGIDHTGVALDGASA